jgi:flagellar biosynthesis/type III secretory pathway protein FliH
VCFSNSNRKATIKPALSFGKCEKCKKPQGNPLTHTCHPKSDFKRRKSQHEKQQKAATRKKRQQSAHDYQACQDKDCPRPLCVAFKAGWKDGHEEGFADGYGAGYASGFPDGIAACPGPHTG